MEGYYSCTDNVILAKVEKHSLGFYILNIFLNILNKNRIIKRNPFLSLHPSLLPGVSAQTFPCPRTFKLIAVLL